MYVFIGCVFWTDHISLYKLDLSYLYIIITNYDDMYFIVKTHFVLCLLLSNDKFCIHFGGSLEYWISDDDDDNDGGGGGGGGGGGDDDDDDEL